MAEIIPTKKCMYCKKDIQNIKGRKGYKHHFIVCRAKWFRVHNQLRTKGMI